MLPGVAATVAAVALYRQIPTRLNFPPICFWTRLRHCVIIARWVRTIDDPSCVACVTYDKRCERGVSLDPDLQLELLVEKDG